MSPRSLIECLRFIVAAELYTSTVPVEKIKNKYKVTKFALIYTNAATWLSISGLLIGVAIKLSDRKETHKIFDEFSSLGLFVGGMEIFMSLITAIVSKMNIQFHKYNYIDIIESLQQLDASLIKEFQPKMNYYKIHRKNVVLVTVFTIYYLSVWIFVFVTLVEDDYFFSILVGFCYGFVAGTPAASNYSAMNFADLLKVRMRLLHKLLDPDYLVKRYKNEKVRKTKLMALAKNYQHMCVIMQKISRVYGLSLLIVHFHDFTTATSQIYFLYSKSSEGSDSTGLYILFVLWMLPGLWKTTVLPLYTHVMINEAKACIPMILNAERQFTKTDVKGIVQTFAYWNLHNKIRISVFGFFNSDLTFGFAMCSGVTSYLLVLIQFKMQEDSR